MHSMRRLRRGYVMTGLMWAAAWSIVGVIISPLFPAKVGVESMRFVRSALALGFGGGVIGYMAGLMFAASVIHVGRKHALEALSVRKFAGWGVPASLVFAIPSVIVVLTMSHQPWSVSAFVAVCGGALLCAGSTAGTLLLAKRGARLDQSRHVFELPAVEHADISRENSRQLR